MANHEMPLPIRLWVEALRSGKYRQTTQCLHDRDGYCCLGVLCEVAIDNGVKVKVSEGGGTTLYGGQEEKLPESVQEWAGLHDNLGYTNGFESIFINSDPYDNLVKANDSGVAFASIADAIETQWPKLVKEETK